MLTIEQLRAMSPANREGYLRSLDNQRDIDEREAERLLNKAADLRADAFDCKVRADAKEGAAKHARAYFATLEAAGLWPVAAPPVPDKEQP